MRVHPFMRDAPYMQAYEALQLDNDRQTEMLLRHLNPNGGPSFHDYGKRHPQTVLDLGCGEGHWALHAASTWKHSRIVGFDLVDITLDDFDTRSNLEFVQGNFLKRKLPFEDQTFDLVRMANLTLAIPYNKWKFVISEVNRVLTVGGRLEVIDDQFFFPYGREPAQTSGSDMDDSDDDDELFSDDDDDTLENESDSLSDPAPTLVDSDSSSCSSHEKSKEADPVTLLTQPPSAFDMPPHPDLLQVRPPGRPWSEQVSACADLEAMFQRMLIQKYGIHPRPSEFLPDVLKQVFGKPNAGKLKSMHLKVAHPDPISPSSPDNDENSPTGKGSKKNWMSLEWDKKKQFSTVPEGISAKAAGRLGINYSTLAAATAAATANRAPLISSQTTSGLLLWPSTFIPLPQAELEMHVSKHMHTLLGCKPALRDYLTSFLDDEGNRIMDIPSFEDYIWDYEMFLRQRFNWPSGLPGNFEVDDTAKSKRGSSESSDYVNSLKHKELLHVRSLRVFEAIKS